MMDILNVRASNSTMTKNSLYRRSYRLYQKRSPRLCRRLRLPLSNSSSREPSG